MTEPDAPAVRERTRRQVRDFLTTRRARVTPERAGLPNWGGGHRRVPGLRREEVALLAGMSVDYYTRLERGNLGGVSESVLSALAGALQLDEAERAHLFDLARTANVGGRSRSGSTRRSAPALRPSVLRVLDALTDAPAYLRNGRRDVLATNRLGRALYSPLFSGPGTDPGQPVNIARFLFLDPSATTFYADWEGAAADSVAALRIEAGRDPLNRGLSDLIGELCTRSDEFSRRWATHNVRFHQTGRKLILHPVVGRLELTFDSMELPADPGLAFVVHSAEPGSPSADGLRLLASWAATQDAGETTWPQREADHPSPEHQAAKERNEP